MAGKKISQLPPVASPALTDIFPAVQSGITGQETLQQLLTLLINNIGSGTIPALTVTTLTATNITASSITFSPTTGGIVGTTTNDNAAAGKVGEFISSHILNGAATPVTRNIAQNVTMISLTAGDWDVWGNISYNASSVAAYYAGINTVSATFPDASLLTQLVPASIFGAGGPPAPQQRLSLSTTTIVYLVTYLNAATGALTAQGGIYARRAR